MPGRKRERTNIKKPVNAYLFLLAKRLAQYSYFGLENPSDLQYVKSVYDSYKSEKFAHTVYLDAATRKVKKGDVIVIEEVKLDPYAKGIANRIHKILKTQDLYFTNGMLDHLVKEIKFSMSIGRRINSEDNVDSLREFNTWLEFADKFKDDRGALEADKLCRSKLYSDLSIHEKRVIQDAVEYKCMKLQSRDQRIGHRYGSGYYSRAIEECVIIANNDSYTIRSAARQDIPEAVSLRNKKNLLENRQLEERLLAWRDANSDSVYLYIDEQGVGGYICLLPVTEGWFEELINGEKFSKPILKSDIVRPEDAHQVQYVLIETVMAVTPKAKILLKFYIPLMLENLLKSNQQHFSLFYIASEKDEEGSFQNFGFIDYAFLTGENIRDIKTLYLAKGRTILAAVQG